MSYGNLQFGQEMTKTCPGNILGKVWTLIWLYLKFINQLVQTNVFYIMLI